MYCYFIYLSSYVALMAAVVDMPDWLIFCMFMLQIVALFCCRIVEGRQENILQSKIHKLQQQIDELERNSRNS